MSDVTANEMGTGQDETIEAKGLTPKAVEGDVARMASSDPSNKPDGKEEPEGDNAILFGVHPLRHAAFLAFERELPRLQEELFALGCSEKEWVVFHGEKYLGHARRKYDLLHKWCTEEGIPLEEVYCHTLMPVLTRIKVFRSDII